MASREKQEKLYSYWMNEIRRAQRVLDLDNKAAQWKENLDYITKPLQYETGKKGTMPVYNELAIAATELQVALYPNDPMPGIGIYREYDEKLAELCEKLVQQDLRRCKMVKRARQAVQDNLVCDLHVLKVTYKAGLGEIPDGPDVGNPAVVAKNQAQIGQENAAMMMGQVPSVQNSDLHQLHIASHRHAQMDISTNDPMWSAFELHIMIHDQEARPLIHQGVSFSRVNPKNYLWDPEAAEYEDRRWEAERSFVPVADLKGDKILKNTKDIQGSQFQNTIRLDSGSTDPRETDADNPDPPTLLDEDDDEHLYVVKWTIHDRVNQELIILVEDHPDNLPCLVTEWPYVDHWGREIPIYLPLIFNEVNDRIDGISDIERAKPIQEKYNEIMSWRDDHVSKFRTRKLLREKATFDQVSLAQYRDPNQNEVELPPGSLAKMKVEDLVPYPQDAYAYANELREHIRRIIGVYEITQAIPKATTATVGQILNNQQMSRLSDRQRKMAEWIEAICETVLRLHQKFTTTDIVIKLTGEDGSEWQRLDPSQIPDDFNFFVDVDGWYSANPELQVRQMTEALPVMTKIPGFDAVAFAIEWCRKKNIRNPERFRIPQPMMPPMGMMGPGPQAGQPGGVAPPAGPDQVPPWALGQMAGNASNSQVQPVGMA